MTSISRYVRRGLVAGAAVLVLGGAAVGIAAAQAQPTTPDGQSAQSGHQKFIDALAKRLGVQASALETAISQARTDAGLPADGRGFPGKPGGLRGRAFRLALSTAAQTLNITPEQLRTELQGKSLAEVATAHGKTANDVTTALKNAVHARIDQAVTAGRLTQDQANQRKAAADQRIDQLVNRAMPLGGPGGHGFGGHGGGRGVELTAAAQALGITADQLRTELPGKSLAQVAAAHGTTATDVATALKNAAHTRIDQAVTAGRLTPDQANQQKTRIDQRIDQMVNQVMPQRGPRAAGEDSDA